MVLVLASFVVCSLILALEIGLSLTPYETADSRGRTMGFNDPFTLEHYWIMLKHLRPEAMFQKMLGYSWVLLAAHLAGMAILAELRKPGRVRLRWFFAVQFLIFPLGFVGSFFFPFILWTIVRGNLDRESVVDLPLVMLIAQFIWLVMSGAAFFALREGLRQRKKTLSQAC